MIAGHSARSDSSQFLLPFQGSVLQNTDHVACEYAHNVLYWSVAHNCHENQNDCIILLATQAQCAELLKWPTYDAVCTIWSWTLCQFLNFCSVVLEESLLWGYDTASLGSWFVTALCYNIFEPVTQWHVFSIPEEMDNSFINLIN